MKYIISAVIMLFSLAIGAQSNSLEIPLSSPGQPGKLDVYIKSGEIIIKGSDRQDVLIEYMENLEEEDDDDDHSRSKGKWKGKKKGLKKIGSTNLNLKITEENNYVKVKRTSLAKSIKVIITIPRNFEVEAQNYMGGNITVEDIQGELSLDSYTGNIYASRIVGSVSASTYAGEITVGIDELIAENAMSFSTYSGEIDITFPTDSKLDYKMKTNWGDIYSDIELTVKDVKAEVMKEQEGNAYKVYTDGWTFASSNGGGPEMKIKTEYGSIYLRAKE